MITLLEIERNALNDNNIDILLAIDLAQEETADQYFDEIEGLNKKIELYESFFNECMELLNIKKPNIKNCKHKNAIIDCILIHQMKD